MLTESCETKIEILLHQNEILGPFLVKKKHLVKKQTVSFVIMQHLSLHGKRAEKIQQTLSFKTLTFS